MKKFHIGKNGPTLCRAKIKCTLNSQHFETIEAAEQEYKKQFEQIRSITKNELSKVIQYKPNPYNDIYITRENELIEENMRKYPYKDNVDELSKEELRRIKTMALWKNLNEEALQKAACSSPASWAAIILPSISKQNYYEETLVNHINIAYKNYNAISLPNGGPNSLYLVQGNIVKRETRLKKEFKTKTLDLLIENTVNNEKIHCVAKRTVGSGGSQDNQHNDAVAFIEEQTIESKNKILLILDGDYYTTIGKDETINKLDNINNIIHEKKLDKVLFVSDYKNLHNILK